MVLYPYKDKPCTIRIKHRILGEIDRYASTYNTELAKKEAEEFCNQLYNKLIAEFKQDIK